MKSAGEPFITIIMPCYNGERYLAKSLEAFALQDYPNKKLVIVDGKSTDNSHRIIEDFISKGYPLVWDRTLDIGISSAINIGLRHMDEDDIFGYLGADDILMPSILNEIAFLFRTAPDIDGLYFDSFSYHSESGNLSYRKCPSSEFSIASLLKFGTIAGLQNIYIKGNHVKANKFNEMNKYSMDYDLYVRLARSGRTRFAYIPKSSTINLMHDNLSTKFMQQGAKEALDLAISHFGYSPRLLLRALYLRLSHVKDKLFVRHG